VIQKGGKRKKGKMLYFYLVLLSLCLLFLSPSSAVFNPTTTPTSDSTRPRSRSDPSTSDEHDDSTRSDIISFGHMPAAEGLRVRNRDTDHMTVLHPRRRNSQSDSDTVTIRPLLPVPTRQTHSTESEGQSVSITDEIQMSVTPQFESSALYNACPGDSPGLRQSFQTMAGKGKTVEVWTATFNQEMSTMSNDQLKQFFGKGSANSLYSDAARVNAGTYVLLDVYYVLCIFLSFFLSSSVAFFVAMGMDLLMIKEHSYLRDCFCVFIHLYIYVNS
jgi:hypothetical protein